MANGVSIPTSAHARAKEADPVRYGTCACKVEHNDSDSAGQIVTALIGGRCARPDVISISKIASLVVDNLRKRRAFPYIARTGRAIS